MCNVGERVRISAGQIRADVDVTFVAGNPNPAPYRTRILESALSKSAFPNFGFSDLPIGKVCRSAFQIARQRAI